MLNYTVEFIENSAQLSALAPRLNEAEVIALDIETINWWDREAERVSLIQVAFREAGEMRVAVIDALSGDALTGFDPETLRQPLELSLKLKAIHNACYDAVRMARHFRINTSPIHDTMLAARRSGEKKCSLQAQAAAHLGLQLDKDEQRSDWSRRPLSDEQLRYAALDAVSTLLLYEDQVARGLRGDYELRDRIASKPGAQAELPMATSAVSHGNEELDSQGMALLGIVVELSGRYSPQQLAASVGSERVGLAGWIIDRALGVDADIDEETVKQEIASLREQGLIHLSPSRRLDATPAGQELWRITQINR